MKIAIIGGTGKLGLGLVGRALSAGHEVIIGSRDADRAKNISERIDTRVRGMSNAEAARLCDAAILSVPYSAHRITLEPLASLLTGKLLIDTTVPIDPTNPKQVRTESGRSAAEEADEILGHATATFAAFQTVSFNVLRNPDHSPEILVAGPQDRKGDALSLIEGFGVSPIYIGPLSSACYLEQLTLLLITINYQYQVKNAGLRIVGID